MIPGQILTYRLLYIAATLVHTQPSRGLHGGGEGSDTTWWRDIACSHHLLVTADWQKSVRTTNERQWNLLQGCLCLAVKTQVKRKPCTMRCDLMQMRESAGCVVRFTKVLLLTIDPGIADILGVKVPRKLFTNADWFSVNKYHSVWLCSLWLFLFRFKV